nr:nucleotide-binding alpha-beta plait domain-containing protein [Tanacetum cinerariifolium]
MGIFKTKEDDVAKISTSVFITNFPESVSAKELFQSCKQYGHVVDTFIPNKRSMNGKRFGFVRFINVFNDERLVNNLNTVWIDRFKLHANIAQFHRPPISSSKNTKKGGEDTKGGSPKLQMTDHSKLNANTKVGHSYVGVVKGGKELVNGGVESTPTIVLGDECVRTGNVSKALLGRVKEFAYLANLKMALINEGFVDIKIKYMGELWVMLEFSSEESTKLFRDNVSTNVWFSQVIEANNEFETDGRITWVEVEGIPFNLWTRNTLKRIAVKWGELLDIDDQEETCFHSKRLCIYMKSGRSVMEDFKITHKGKPYWIRANETTGWVPDFEDEPNEEDQDEIDSIDTVHNNQFSGSVGDENEGDEVPETVFVNDGLANFQKEGDVLDKHDDQLEDPFNIYPLLNKNNNKEKKENNSGSSLNYPPGFTPINNDESSVHEKGGCNDNGDAVRSVDRKVNSDAFSGKHSNIKSKEDRIESKSSGFEYVHSDAVGNSGKKLLLIAVYAPHDIRDKQMLWDYLNQEIGKWKGEVVMMGDFNEELETVDAKIDEGKGDEEDTRNRMEIINSLKRYNKLESTKIAQKAKIKWAVEGDENLRFFHGMLNKRQNTLNIRGVLVDGIWMDSPNKVKNEFLDHFKKWFCTPGERGASLLTEFPKQLNVDQQKELECEVSNKEIKRAVWECGTDKAPGPDGFTFGFFRHFWNLIDKDVYEAVRRWQKKMPFLLTTLKVVYVLTTPMPQLLEDATVEAIRIRNWKLRFEHLGGLLAGIHGLFSGRYCGLVRRVTCGYPWPGLGGNHMDFGMIQERLRSSAWCLSD